MCLCEALHSGCHMGQPSQRPGVLRPGWKEGLVWGRGASKWLTWIGTHVCVTLQNFKSVLWAHALGFLSPLAKSQHSTCCRFQPPCVRGGAAFTHPPPSVGRWSEPPCGLVGVA